MAELEPGEPRPRRPALVRGKTGGRKDAPRNSDGAQDTARDRSPRRVSGKSLTTESKKRRSVETPPSSGSSQDAEGNGIERERVPLRDQRAEYQGSDGYAPSSKQRKKNDGCRAKLPKLSSVITVINRGLPTPARTPVNRSPRTPSLNSLTSKLEQKLFAITHPKRPKAPPTPPEEVPPTETNVTPEKRRYKFGRLLGKGSYGDVYLCKGPDERYYAVKTLKPAKEGDNRRKERQYREEQLLRFFRDSQDRPDSIINFYETFRHPFQKESEPRICHAMEWCQGSMLASKIKHEKIEDPSKLKSITRQTLEGLRFLHDNNIVHCDLKPENIMFKYNQRQRPGDFTIRIIDVGLAEQLTEPEQVIRNVGGTPMYHPQEVFTEKLVSCKMDMWAFGIVLWEMLHRLNSFPIFPISSGKAREKKKDEPDAREFVKEWNEHEFKKELKFDSKEWEQNFQAIPLAKGLLQKDHKLRISAREALMDKWLTEGSEQISVPSSPVVSGNRPLEESCLL